MAKKQKPEFPAPAPNGASIAYLLAARTSLRGYEVLMTHQGRSWLQWQKDFESRTAVLLKLSAGEFVPKGTPTPQADMLWPAALILLTHSAELFLKSVRDKPIPKGKEAHDLLYLFTTTSGDFQTASIKASGLTRKEFMARLMTFRDAFVEWRYPLQNGNRTINPSDLHTLGCAFDDAINEVYFGIKDPRTKMALKTHR